MLRLNYLCCIWTRYRLWHSKMHICYCSCYIYIQIDYIRAAKPICTYALNFWNWNFYNFLWKLHILIFTFSSLYNCHVLNVIFKHWLFKTFHILEKYNLLCSIINNMKDNIIIAFNFSFGCQLNRININFHRNGFLIGFWLLMSIMVKQLDIFIVWLIENIRFWKRLFISTFSHFTTVLLINFLN